MYQSLALGELYDSSRTSYPETSQLRLSRSICELTIFVSSPTSQEKDDLSHGRLQFALVDLAPHLLMFGFQMGSQDWWDCPFEVQRLAPDERQIQGVPGQDLPFRMMLVDASTGVLVAWRFLDLPAEFADHLRHAVAGQLTSDYDADTAQRMQAFAYDKYPTPLAMFRDLSDAVCQVD